MQALDNVRVLDCSNVIAGPYCASILAEFGADVIKIEMPGKGDSFRNLDPRKDGVSTRWPSMGRNKRCITLDFHFEEGKKLFLELVKQSDVIIENFRTGTFDKWGLDMDTLKKANPKIIVTRVTGYGQTGPYRNMSGFGTPVSAFSGVVSISGYKDRPPVVPSFSLVDYIAGQNAAIGTLLALYNRDGKNARGNGQEIDCSLYEPIFHMMDEMIAEYDILGTIPERSPFIKAAGAPGGLYKTKDGKWIVLTCSNANTFAYFMELLGHPEYKDKYTNFDERMKAKDHLEELATNWVNSNDFQFIKEKCQEKQIPMSLVYTIEDIWSDPQYVDRKNLVEIESEDFGTVHIPSVSPILSETPGEIKWAGEKIGSRNEEVYKGLLNLSDKEIQELREKHII